MFVGKKNDEFSFSVKLMPKLVCLTNAIVLDNIFPLKVQMSQSRTADLNLIQLSLSWITTFNF